MADAQAQYAIDIAATMQGADLTLAQLDQLTNKLMGGSKDASYFGEALQQLGGSLDSAKAATQAANDALAAGTAEYRVLEAAASDAAKAAEKAAKKNGGVIPDDEKEKLTAATAAVDAYAGKLRGLEQAAEGARKKQDAYATQLGDVGRLQKRMTDRLGDATTKMSTFRGALGDVGGPLGTLGEAVLFPAQAFVDLREQFGSAAAAATVAVVGIVAVGAAVVALGVAMAVGLVKTLAWSIGLADAARSADLARQTAEAVTPALKGMSGQFEELSTATGLGDESLRGLSKSLLDAKVKTEELPKALRSAAVAEAALGQGGAASFIADLKSGKLAVGDFANEVEDKFGGIVAKKMLGLDAQSARFKKNISSIFGAMNIEPALEGLRTLVELFDKNTATGQTMKFLFESVFQPLIDKAKTAAYVVEAFAIGFLIGMTKLYIKLKPVIATISELFGYENPSLEKTLLSAKNAGEMAAGVFVVFAAAIAAVVAAVGAIIASFVLVPVAIAKALGAVVSFGAKVVGAVKDTASNVVKYFSELDLGASVAATMANVVSILGNAAAPVFAAITTAVQPILDVFASIRAAVEPGIQAVTSFGPGLVTAFQSAVSAVRGFLSGINLVQIGTDLITGLAQGITSGAGAVLAAITGVVTGVIGKAKSLLGIASPSTVMADVGTDTDDGYIGSVEEGIPEAQAAVAELVAPPEPEPIPPPELSGEVPAIVLPAPELSGEVPVLPAPEVPDAAVLSEPAIPDLPPTALSAQDALSGNLGPPPVSDAPVSTTTPSAGSSIDLSGATFNFFGIEGAEDAQQRFEEVLTRILEGDAAQLGGEQAA